MMRYALALALSLAPVLALSSMQASAQQPGFPTTLKNLRETRRPLLIFARSPEDPQLQIQLRTLHDNAQAIAERDLAVIALPFRTPSPTALTLTEADAYAARHRFNVAPTDFTVILLGKDGGEKLRARKPIPFATLRETIDAMPMRQEEMRQDEMKEQVKPKP